MPVSLTPKMVSSVRISIRNKRFRGFNVELDIRSLTRRSAVKVSQEPIQRCHPDNLARSPIFIGGLPV